MSKKVLAVLLAVLMSLQLFGCGDKKEAANNPQAATPDKGRYVEKDVTLPDNIKGEDIIQIGKMDDSLCVYTMEEDGNDYKFVCYLYKDGSFTVHTPAWLESIRINKEDYCSYMATKIVNNVAGKSFLFCSLNKDESIVGHLYFSNNGTDVVDGTPADWLVEDPDYHFYDIPTSVMLLENGTLVAPFYRGVKLYNTETMEKTAEIPVDKQYMETTCQFKNQFYMLATSDGMTLSGIEVYDEKGTIANNISVGEYPCGSSYMDTLSDGTIILASKSGLFKVSAEGQWEQLVQGIYTSLALEDKWCVGFTAFDNGVYYGLFAQDDTRMIEMYEYDPEVSNTPDTTLTVYSLYDNATLNQAAVVYSKEHPETLIKIETAISSNSLENPTEADALQAINAKLLSDDCPDLLVLDGMNKNSMIDKKLLVDMSDVISPMIQDGTLLPNIMNNYVTGEGAVYCVPLKFSFDLVLGGKTDASTISTVKDLATVLSTRQESVLGARTINDLVNGFVPYMVKDIVKDKQLDKEALKQDIEYLKTIAENCGIVSDYGEHERHAGTWELASEVEASIENCNGFLDAIFPMGVVAYVKGTFTAFENTFNPIGELSITTKCENVDAAKDFIKYALGFDNQNGDHYDGFAINTKALENQKTIDRTGWGFETDIAIGGGAYDLLSADEISGENMDKLIAICKTVDKPAVNDTQISKVIVEELPKYLNGEVSLDDTITQIEKSLNMYLAE